MRWKNQLFMGNKLTMKTESEILDYVIQNTLSLLKDFEFKQVNRIVDKSFQIDKAIFYKEPLSVTITANLNPHDYPYTMTVTFTHDTNENPGFIELSDLLIKEGIEHNEVILPINNDSELNNSVKKVIHYLTLIFQLNIEKKIP
jgi:hypothetical protein